MTNRYIDASVETARDDMLRAALHLLSVQYSKGPYRDEEIVEAKDSLYIRARGLVEVTDAVDAKMTWFR
jgi:hypothetical protein